MSSYIKKIFVSDGGKERITVPEFYKGRSILVTGFSGLIGKLVVEKLLWSCPDVEQIYILIRSKRGLSPQERLTKITNLLAFDRVRQKYPNFESKLVAVNGDISMDGLGLSEEDKISICNNVSIVIHSAASVRFDDAISVAINMNMVGTKRVLDLALDIRQLECFVHVSTAYSNSDRFVIKEELYPPSMNWRDAVKISDQIQPDTLQILSQKLMGIVPNTYIFTKALTEHVVNDYKNQFPIVINRPAVVVPAFAEPVPGWIDNQFGPLGINYGFITGIVRCGYADGEQYANYVHTDFVVNSIILSAYQKVVLIEDKLDIPIYNACSPPSYKCTHEDYKNLHLHQPTQRYLNEEGINYYTAKYFNNEACFTANFLFRHMISALLIDLLLIIMSKPPMLTKIRRNTYIAMKRIRYFVVNSITFHVDNFLNLPQILTQQDVQEFHYDFTKCNMKDVYYNALVLSKKVLMKPMYKHIDVTRKVLKWLYILDTGSVILTYLTSMWFVYHFNLPSLCFNYFIDFFTLPCHDNINFS